MKTRVRRISTFSPRGLAVLVALSSALAFPLPAAAVGTVDPAGQDMGEFADSAPVRLDVSIAQTFTPSLSGDLDSVALSMGKDTDRVTADPLVVYLETTTNGLPTGTVLASATLQATEIAGVVPEFPLAIVRFETPAVVVAGTRYAIVVRTRETAQPYAMAATAQPYAGGQLLVDTGGGWTTLNGTRFEGFMLRFQTMVTRARGNDPWPVGYADFGAYAMCDFDDGTRDMCPDQEHPYVPCYLSDGRTVLCADRDFHG